MGLPERLAELEAAGRPIRIGLVGVGQMGAGLIGQTTLTKGLRVVAAADIYRERVLEGLEQASSSAGEVVTVTADDVRSGEADALIAAGKRLAMQDAIALCELKSVDVIVEATGVPNIGAAVALHGLLGRKHVVMLNVETDVTVGYLLKRLADAVGVVYTTSAGDEPGAIKELYDFAVAMGFEVVCVGKGKNNPLDHSATPTSVAQLAQEQQMGAKMLASFRDGSKTMVEMTAVANSTRLTIDRRGMHGVPATVDTLSTLLVPQADGGILSGRGRVEYVTGPVAPGVFVIITTDQPKVIQDLRYLKLGTGPYWALYRPYHLANIETNLSVARAFLYQEATAAPNGSPVAETIAVAKRDLFPGDVIDGIGGNCVYASVDGVEAARADHLVPIGIIEGAHVRVAVPQGTLLQYEHLELDERAVIVQLRHLQDAILYGNGMRVPELAKMMTGVVS